LTLPTGAYVRISVIDKGVGISRDVLPRIFDPFFTTKENGSGLGLSIAYSVIKKHNGLITITSDVGVGTSVYIYLPASREKLHTVSRVQELFSRGKAKILLMDDEEFLLDAISSILRSLGYSIETAVNGQKAIDLVKQAKLDGNPFEVVILDLTIPGGMGGKQAIKEIRKIDPDVKAIAASGYSDDPVIADPEQYGFKGALRKPYTVDELSDLLDLILYGP
jgi:CheY-like chemotaxis protein